MPNNSYVWIPDRLPRKFRYAPLGGTLYPTRLRPSQRTKSPKREYELAKGTDKTVGMCVLTFLMGGAVTLGGGIYGMLSSKLLSWLIIIALVIVAFGLFSVFYNRFLYGYPPLAPGDEDIPIAAFEVKADNINRQERLAALYATIMATPGALTALSQDWADMCDLADEATRAANAGTEDLAVLSAYDMALQRYADHITAKLRSISRADNAPNYPTDDAAERARAILNRVPTDQSGDLS